MSPSRPPEAANTSSDGSGLFRCCCCSVTSAAILLHIGPELAALVCFGRVDHLPQRADSHVGYRLRRHLGRSQFAAEAAYYPVPILSHQHREAYQREGYLILRGLLPPTTVTALQQELLRNYSFDIEKNAHLESDALLDFLAFGPLGGVAAQLFGSDSAYLLRSVLHFRPTVVSFKRVARYHYDWLECEEDLPPRGSGQHLVKFNIALYDHMPGMWFLNESAFESLVLQRYNKSFLDSFTAGPRGPPSLPQEDFDSLSLKPHLRLGDVIAHSAVLTHRSPDAPPGSLIGFLSPSYVAPGSRCRGRRASNRECDWGEETSERDRHSETPQIVDVSHPDCFPHVYPAAAVNKRRGKYNISFRKNFNIGPIRRYLSNSFTRFLFLAPGHAGVERSINSSIPHSNDVVNVHMDSTRRDAADAVSAALAGKSEL